MFDEASSSAPGMRIRPLAACLAAVCGVAAAAPAFADAAKTSPGFVTPPKQRSGSSWCRHSINVAIFRFMRTICRAQCIAVLSISVPTKLQPYSLAPIIG